MQVLSDRAQAFLGQPMFKMKQKIGDRDVVHLEIGDPDFETPAIIVGTACESLRKGETHYCSSYGISSFIEEICKATQRSRGFTPNADQVLITPGANIGIFYAVMCTCNPGDIVLVPDPGFPTYASAIQAAGCIPVFYSLPAENEFKIDPIAIEYALRRTKAKLVILNSPSNPTGAVTSADTLAYVYEILAQHDTYGYSDEIYARLVYDGSFNSIAIHDHCATRIILSNGFSKAYAMTGFRLGAMIAPAALTEKMMLLLQTTQSCVSPFIQRAGEAALLSNQRDSILMLQEYRKRRDVLVSGLNALGLRCPMPQGAFYAFPAVPAGYTSESFADRLLDFGVACLPGSDFGPQGEGFVRMAYCTSLDNINLALERIKCAL